MTSDIVPELKSVISAALSKNLRADPFIQEFWKRLQETGAGGLTLEEVQKYSEHLGEATAKALRESIGPGVLPDDKMYWNIANRLVRPILESNFDDIQATANRVQKSIDESEGIGLNGVAAELDEERLSGLMDCLADSDSIEKTQNFLGEPVVNFHMHSYDEWVKANAKFRAGTGMESKVIRRGHFGMCKWCAALVGTFPYDEDSMPADVFRRHARCRCVVLFTSERGKVQDVHSKIEYSHIRDARVARLRQVAREQREKEEHKKIMRDRVKNGEYNLTLLKQKYAEHVDGTPQYKNTAKERGIEPSRLTVSYEEAQRLINAYSGTGEPKVSNGGKVMDIEFVRLDKTVGQYKDGGTWVDTKWLAIYHSKKGTHIVPVPPGKGR